jgi:UDP-2,3-diacylglucosamine pyrophosphatase LpxH
MLKIVVSDFHVSAGSPPGRLNPYEDFHYDADFAEFLQHYSTGEFEKLPVELIINGDFFDPLKVPINGLFPDRITSGVAVQKVGACLNGHPALVQGLRAFLDKPGKSLTYQMGNHDLEIAFVPVQDLLRSVLGGPRRQDRVSFRIFEPHYDLPGGVRICHGHMFEALNRVDLKRLFLTRGYAEPILNLPWGSIFMLKVLLPVKHERPYINLVAPFGRYLAFAMVTDTSVALPASVRALYHFTRTRFVEAHKRSVSFRHTLRILREEAVVTPDLEDSAFEMFRQDPTLTAVLMGHSHGARIRRYGTGGQTYINTGTWTKLISLDLPDLGVHTRFTYALVDYRGRPASPKVGLFRWFGTQKPFSELHY